MNNVSVLAIGSELLDGRILNTNAQFLSRKLNIHNIKIQEILTVDDDIELICNAISYLAKSTNYIITSGGLGPTSDDLTRFSIAKYFNVNLYEDPNLILDIKNWYEQKKREFIDTNRIQALIPNGSIPIKNNNGTAPGFITSNDKLSVACLPGVPRELHAMFEETVLPDILLKNPNAEKSFQTTFKLFGIAESLIQNKVSNVVFPINTRIIYQVQFPEVKVIFVNNSQNDNLIAKNLFKETIGNDFIIAEEDLNLSQIIHNILLEKKLTLSLAESCSGGFLSNLITNNPSSSRYFLGSITCYDNSIKELIGVNKNTLINYGAVSQETVEELVINITDKFNTNCGIAISGVAGPSGGTEEKPVGTVWIAVKFEDQIISKKYFWNYSREQIKQFAAFQSLDLLRNLIK